MNSQNAPSTPIKVKNFPPSFGSRGAAKRWSASLLLASLLLLGASSSVNAATLYWEPTGTTGTNASGTWTTVTSTLDWTTDSTGLSTGTTNYINGSDAIFSADPSATGPSTVTLGTATLRE